MKTKRIAQPTDLKRLTWSRQPLDGLDLIRENCPTITPEASLAEALKAFAHYDGDRLPVIASHGEHRLTGSIFKSDLILALAEETKQEDTPHT